MMDSDLQQYNGTASFPSTADVGTNADPYLIPTDGPIVSADNNGLGFAPVNRVTKRIKELLLGLRGAIIGDFAGAVRKTVYSWYADGIGGNTQTKPAGTITAAGPGVGLGVTIEAETGDIRASNDDIVAQFGNVVAMNGLVIAGDLGAALFSALRRHYLYFVGTAGTGANPPLLTSTPNQLRAKNIPKGWGYIHATSGIIDQIHGFGNWAVSAIDLGGGYASRYRVRFDLNDPMDNAFYAPLFLRSGPDGTANVDVVLLLDTITPSRFDLVLNNGISPVNVTTNDWSLIGVIMGQQTT